MRGSIGPAMLVAGNVVVGLAAVATAAVAPRAGDHVAVVLSPTASPEAAVLAVAASGGVVVAATRRDWIVIATSSDADFVDRLYRAGALVVADTLGLAGCEMERVGR